MATKTDRAGRLPTTNRYEFQKVVGAGAMGTVYRALDRRTGETVAVKVLKFSVSEQPTLHLRLAREFKAAHELEHPNIVRALAFENDGETSFVVYDFFDACSLGERIEKFGRLDPAEAVRVVTQVAQALEYAHRRKVVHRDVKPDNILLLADGRVKLTDFGLAKDYSNPEDADLTRQASGLGTPHFMAPEQFNDAKNAGPLCDVYSLGATLYNLITGRLPFDAKNALAILTKKETGKLTPARTLVPHLGEAIDAAILAAVDPDPARRVQSCLGFFKLLHRREGMPSVDPKGTPLLLPEVEPGGPANRRAFVRFPVRVGTLAAVDVNVHADREGEEVWPLVLQDLSAGGLKVLLARRFEPGSELQIELTDGPGGRSRRFPIRIVRVQRDRAGHWVHGCTFAKPLSDLALRMLLKQV